MMIVFAIKQGGHVITLKFFFKKKSITYKYVKKIIAFYKLPTFNFLLNFFILDIYIYILGVGSGWAGWVWG